MPEPLCLPSIAQKPVLPDPLGNCQLTCYACSTIHPGLSVIVPIDGEAVAIQARLRMCRGQHTALYKHMLLSSLSLPVRNPRQVCLHAGRLQAASEAFGLFFASGALHVQLHAAASAIAFMTKYADRVNFPQPVLAPQKPAWLRGAVAVLAGVDSLPSAQENPD